MRKEYSKKKIGSLNIAKIFVDQDACIGCGTCVSLAPEVFELDASGKSAVVKNSDGADDEKILAAARACPVQAILLLDQQEKPVF